MHAPSTHDGRSIDSWDERVANYVDDLEATATQLQSILDQTRVDATHARGEDVQQSTERLQVFLSELETKIAQRQALLEADDAPKNRQTGASPLSLAEALRSSESSTAIHLAQRCDEISQQIATAHQQALSLFVCQYHLADFSNEMARILAGSEMPVTYSREANPAPQVSGGLFNEAA